MEISLGKNDNWSSTYKVDAIVVKFPGDQMFDHLDNFVVRFVNFSAWGYLEGVITPSGHCRIFIEIPWLVKLAGKMI